MSSTTPPLSTESSYPSQPPNNNSNNGLGGATSNLYLVTFLATLFLLLFVSCAIVLRSYILRRRYQRRLEEAMASGLLLAPRAQGSKRKRFGAKPKVFDAWLSHTRSNWTDIMPLAAQPVFVKRKFKEPPKQSPIIPATTSTSINPTLTSDTPIDTTPLSTPPLGSDGNHPLTQIPLSILPSDISSQPTSSRTRTNPWSWLSRRNPTSGSRNHVSPDDFDADEDEYDLAPITTATTNLNPPPSLFPSGTSNRTSTLSRTGPASLTHAYLSGGDQSTGLDAAALRAAAAAGAVPGGSMPLGVMAVAGVAGTYKVRVEMLQVTTLIAMPCAPGRDGKPRVRRIRGNKVLTRIGESGITDSGKDIEENDGIDDSDGESIDDDEEEEKPLPELVFGVTRVNHSSNKAAQVGLVGRMKEF